MAETTKTRNNHISFCVNTMVAGIETTFPLLYDPLRDKYDTTRASVGTSMSLMTSAGSLCALFSTPFINIYGVRPVAFVGCAIQTTGLLLCTFAPTMILFDLSYGVLSGLGYGLLNIPSLTIVQQNFTHNRGLATGVALLGYSNGTILAPILMEYLLQKYGLFGSLLLQAAIHAHNFVFVWAFKSPKEFRTLDNTREYDSTENQNDQRLSTESDLQTRSKKRLKKSYWKNLIDFTIFKDIKFVLYIFVRLGRFFSGFCLNMHIVSLARHLGVSLAKASYLPSIMGVCNLVLRAFSSLVLNIGKINHELYFALGLICIVIGSFLAAAAQGYSYLLGAMIFKGFYEGISTTTNSLVLVNLVGVQSFHKAMAVMDITTIPASLASGPFSGWLVDISGNYVITFVVSGVAGILATMVILIIILLMCLEKSKKAKNEMSSSVTPEELQPLKDKSEEEGVP